MNVKYKKARKPRGKSTKVAKLSKPVKAAVNKLISGRLENKICSQFGLLSYPVNGNWAETVFCDISGTTTGTTTNGFRPMLPKLTEGAALNERIGAQLQPKSLKLRGTIYLATDVSGSRNYTVRLICVTSKQQKQTDELLTNTGNLYTDQLMWDAQADDSVAYEGCRVIQNTIPINRLAYNVLGDKKYHLTCGSASASLTATQQQVFMSSIISQDFEVVLTQKDMPKNLKYDGKAFYWPNNFAPVFGIGIVDNLGKLNNGAGNTAEILVQWSTQLTYEDA